MTPTALEPFLDQAIPTIQEAVRAALTLGDTIVWDLNAQTVMLPTPQGIALQAMYILSVWAKNPLIGQPALAFIHQITDPWHLADPNLVGQLVAQALEHLRNQRQQILAQQTGPTN